MAWTSVGAYLAPSGLPLPLEVGGGPVQTPQRRPQTGVATPSPSNTSFGEQEPPNTLLPSRVPGVSLVSVVLP